MSSQNRKIVTFCHIPKTGGTEILNRLYNTKSLAAEHRVLNKSELSKGKNVLFCVRDPVDWYLSLINFYRFPNHRISSVPTIFASKFENADDMYYAISRRQIPPAFNKHLFNYGTGAPENMPLLTFLTLRLMGGDVTKNANGYTKELEIIRDTYSHIKVEDLDNSLESYCKDRSIPLLPAPTKAHINANIRKWQLSTKAINDIIKNEQDYMKVFDYVRGNES